MPLAIILAASDECKEKAIADGYREQTVLIKYMSSFPTEEQWKAEREVKKHLPYQFCVTNYWGAMPG